ncbi:MAG: MerR family transcriptional regulator [Firmicutes bacterium]|nr:MerR family transcriptional regulator [Bacillota bacterium]
MEYSINKLAKLSGVSSRTLRYYDEIGLLKPLRVSATKYRLYGQKEVDKLQQILFYKELGVELLGIKKLLEEKEFNVAGALKKHLSSLEEKKKQIEILIKNVNKTILSVEGDLEMSNKEKFEGFKKTMIENNEKQYGEEIRKKYGDKAVNASNKKIGDMTEEQYSRIEKLEIELNAKLKEATTIGDPGSAIAQEVCELHKQWLTFYWPKGTYTNEAHCSIAQMYCDDERFKAYYENIAPNSTEFLKNAINIYCKK